MKSVKYLLQIPLQTAVYLLTAAGAWYAPASVHGEMTAEIMPLYVVADDPSQHIVPAGVENGIGDLIISTNDGSFRCTATLLTTGRHALTAAHCLTDALGNLRANSATVKFPAAPSQTYSVSDFYIHPDWDGSFFRGNDIAVIEFANEVSTDVQRYGIDRNGNDDVSLVGEKFGYGRSGTGSTGDTLGSGTRRTGLNLYDDLADTMLQWLGRQPGSDYVPGAVLQYDFDNGLAANDAFGFYFGKDDLGTGDANEVSAAPGDSGGPTLNQVKQITGVTSYSVRLSNIGGMNSDVDSTLNRTFGEFAGDTRVSAYTDFIDDLLGISATVPGDANLDGSVDGLDVSVLSGGFGSNRAHWTIGDFNGDGMSDAYDVSVLSGSFGFQATTPLQEPIGNNNATIAGMGTASGAWLGNDTAVPEPTTLSLLSLLLASLGRRQRHIRDH